MNQQDLNNYFSIIWKPPIDEYQYTGLNLADRITDEWVLDVGCGTNPFKGLIKNLVGIDPAMDQADVKTTIEDYHTDQRFDVAFCLGSINFGSEETIKHQISCVDSLLKPTGRIYWRCNPGRKDHGNAECEQIDFYPWTFEQHYLLAHDFGYHLNECKWDSNNRIFAEWIKNI